ncbi:MAG TPA: single-stranded DNA-binding protein [Nocardioidaceae bacterium]|jgi:single-strand DNA-binding protein
MTETILHVVGHVGTDIDHRRVGDGVDLSTFRLATTPRRWDRQQRAYVDGTTTWFTVQCWRQLAANVRDSLRRGDPVVVIGRLKTEEWTKDDVRNSRIVLEAFSVGHDMARGVSSFRKTQKPVEAADEGANEVREALEDIERVEPTAYDENDPRGNLVVAS